MALEWPVPGHLVGRPDLPSAHLSVAVIPMGWISAVSLFQHLHRRLGISRAPLGAGFPEEMELRRDRPLPQRYLDKQHSWIQYYLDDFDCPRTVSPIDFPGEHEKLSELQKRQRLSYEQNGVAFAEEKAVVSQTHVVRTGAEIDGSLGFVGAPEDVVFVSCLFILWLLQVQFTLR